MRTEPSKMLLAVWICIAFVTQAMATEYTFHPADYPFHNYGDWGFEGNWTPPGGPPGPNDTAIVTHINGNPLECWVTGEEDVGMLIFEDND